MLQFWLLTGLLCLFLLVSAGSYFFHQGTIEGLRELGFPDFFRVQLGILKIGAVLLIGIPGIAAPVREWAYAGTAFFLVTAMVAHISHGDTHWITLVLFILLSLVFLSRHYSP